MKEKHHLEETKRNISERQLSYKHTDETKLKISKALKGRTFTKETLQKMSNSRKGKHHTDEAKRKIGLWGKGRTMSDDTREKIRVAHIGKKHTEETKQKISKNNGMKGKRHTKETIKKMSENSGRKGKRHTEKSKKLMCAARAKRNIPFKDTRIEIKVQNELKKLNIPFEPHKYIGNIKHKYCCDIFIEPNIVIECDGNYWHSIELRPEQAIRDSLRTIEMAVQGYKVLRFWEYEINNDINNVIDRITEYISYTL